jgi:hypothetical protein
MNAFYEYLRAEKLGMIQRRTAVVEGDFLYDEVITDKGRLWVKY